MSSSKGAYAVIAFFAIFLSIVFFFVDGMLLWSIAFFLLGFILILLNIMWDISGWADNVVRKIGDDE